MPEDAELIGVRLDRRDRLPIDRLAERARRMDDRGVDPGLGHLLQGVVDTIGRDLAVLRRHPGVLPKVDLRIDDRQGASFRRRGQISVPSRKKQKQGYAARGLS